MYQVKPNTTKELNSNKLLSKETYQTKSTIRVLHNSNLSPYNSQNFLGKQTEQKKRKGKIDQAPTEKIKNEIPRGLGDGGGEWKMKRKMVWKKPHHEGNQPQG